jgi:hypothetical protein
MSKLALRTLVHCDGSGHAVIGDFSRDFEASTSSERHTRFALNGQSRFVASVISNRSRSHGYSTASRPSSG